MATKLVALLILCSALGVLGREELGAVTYTRLEQEPVRGRAIGIVDGDTIKVLTAGKQQIRVRIAFIDAPEKGQPFGQRAKQALSELVFGEEVELRPHTIDRYGRLVARVLVAGRDVGAALSSMKKARSTWTNTCASAEFRFTAISPATKRLPISLNKWS
jgi:endonuclease YncB( thermonuclease family)